MSLSCRLFNIYVFPLIFLYANNTIGNLNEIESIFKYFNRRLSTRISGSTHADPYAERLRSFCLRPLEPRLIELDLSVLHKIIQKVLIVPSIDITFSTHAPHRISLHSFRTSLYRNFFLHWTSVHWNRHMRNSAPITYSPSKFKDFLSELKPDSTYRGRALKAS